MATIAEFIEEWTSTCPWIEAHTSGSTGTPKSIRLLKSDMRISAQATNRFFGINRNSVLGLPLSVDYIAGKMMVVRALEAGCRLEAFPVSADLNLASCRERIDLLSLVPAQLPAVLSQSSLSDRVRCMLIGGAGISDETAAAVLASGVDAYIGYGMTETCSHVALSSISACGGRVYHAMPDVTFDTDSRGCLTVIAPRFSFRSLQTNDMVELLTPTSFRWCGRYDNVINSGGIKFFAEELEKLYALPVGKHAYYVCSETDELWGQRIVLVVECDAGEIDGIKRGVEAAVADHKRRPKTYIAVRAISRTATSGKIKREMPADDNIVSRIC